jgi:hypothetical protein
VAADYFGKARPICYNNRHPRADSTLIYDKNKLNLWT